MGNYLPQAQVALAKYLERGDKVLALMRNDKIDEALELLRWRNAAFEGFRVAEFLEARNGFDVASDKDLQELWRKSELLNGELARAIKDLQAKAANELAGVRKVKKAIKKYRSGETSPSSFKESI